MNKVKFNELSVYESLTQPGLYIINGLKLHHHLANKNIFGLFSTEKESKGERSSLGYERICELEGKKTVESSQTCQ